MREPGWTDAKFKVIRRPRRQRRGWRIDWGNFLIVGAISVAGLLKVLFAGP
jgi:hypothetical protein